MYSNQCADTNCVYLILCLCVPADPQLKKEDTVVLKLGSLSMAPQADNPLTRTVLRKDIYQWDKLSSSRSLSTELSLYEYDK